MCNKVSLTQKSLPLITVVGQNPTSSADSVLLKPINDTHEAQRMSDINQDLILIGVRGLQNHSACWFEKKVIRPNKILQRESAQGHERIPDHQRQSYSTQDRDQRGNSTQELRELRETREF